MPAGKRANAAKIASRSSSKKSNSASRSSSKKSGWIGTTISNQPGTSDYRAWTFLNLGIDPGDDEK